MACAPSGSRRQATHQLLNDLWSGQVPVIRKASEIDIVGHRVVNGGGEYEEATFITPRPNAAITRMAEFAPLNSCAEFEGVEVIARTFGSVPQVAVFDTGFHSRLPEAAAVYPGPYDWLAQGIRRYGFHGINHLRRAHCAVAWQGFAITETRDCHLGNACALAAIRDGHRVDTAMGFTPLEGLMMGRRSGSVDPGILIYLMRQGSLTGEQPNELRSMKSGLLGIS